MSSWTYADINKRFRSFSETETVALAMRAALRSLPFVFGKDPPAACADRLLAALHGTIVAAPVFVGPDSRSRSAARTAALELALAADRGTHHRSIARQALSIPNGTARAATQAEGLVLPQKGLADAATDAVAKSRSLYLDAASHFSTDLSRLRPDAPALAVFETPLWHAPPPADDIQELIEELLAVFADNPMRWGFWERWFRGHLEGVPLNWALQSAVAQIAETEWVEGPDNIARCIAEIEARHETLDAVTAAEAELMAASRSRLGIGGNHPPEPIEQKGLHVAPELLIAWEPLQHIKIQAAADVADRSVLRAAIDALQRVILRGTEWLASKLDLMVDTAIRWGIPTLGGGYLAMNPDKIEVVIRAAERWLSLLP